MKFVLTLVLASMMSSAFALPLARMVSKSDKKSFKEKIIFLYKREAGKAGSPIAKLIAQLKKENDIPESGSLSLPTEADILQISSGKASASAYGLTFLVGIPAFRNGTGMIEEHAAYIEANVFSEMEVKDTVTLDKRVKIVDAK